MNTGAWHTDSLRRRSAAALFGAGALSCVVDFASVGLRRLAMLHNGEKLQLLAYLIVAVTIAVGIARGNGWAEGAGLLVAIAAAAPPGSRVNASRTSDSMRARSMVGGFGFMTAS